MSEVDHEEATPLANRVPIKTGIEGIDLLLRGYSRGDLVIAGSRPSVGKTSFLLHLFSHLALERKVPSAYFSMAHRGDVTSGRLLASLGCVPFESLVSGRMTEQEWARVIKAAGQLQDATDNHRAFTINNPRLTVDDFADTVRDLKADHDVFLVCVDWLQLLRAEPNFRVANREQEVSFIARELKALALELDICIVAASQMSRGPVSRNEHRPLLSDLRDSGCIEDVADCVLLLYRDEMHNEHTQDQGIMEIKRAKPFGFESAARVVFLSKYLRFHEPEEAAGKGE